MPRKKHDKLDDSINVPVPKALKKRVLAEAEKMPVRIAHTAFTRMLIEEGLNRRQALSTR